MSKSAQLELVKPAHVWVPEYSFTCGPEVVEMNRRANFPPDPEQAIVLDAVFAENADETPAIREIEVVGPRQNIKTGVQLQTMIGWMFLLDIEQALYTAHRWKTAEKTFKTLMAIVNDAPFLRRRVRRFYEGNGEQKMVLTNEHELEFSTRTSGAGQGPARDKLILDEDFASQDLHIGALVPSLATRPMAQLLRGSSAGHAESKALRNIRDRAYAGGDRNLAYFEWCMPPPAEACDLGDRCDHARATAGCGLDKPEMLALGNSQYGLRIPAAHVAWERSTMTPAEFGRERGGWWDKPAAASDLAAMDTVKWADCLDAESEVAGRPRFALDVAPDSTRAAIGVAGYRADRLPHVEITSRGDILDHRPGTDWILPRLLELAETWTDFQVSISGAAGSAALTLQPELEAAGITVDVMPSAKVAAACGLLLGKVMGEQPGVRHIGQPDLTTAATTAQRRDVGGSDGGLVWTRGEQITPLYAVTLALRALVDAEIADAEVSVFGFAELDMCDRCGKNPHEDPDGEHDYLCADCRPKETE